jgi:hypothetical protein
MQQSRGKSNGWQIFCHPASSPMLTTLSESCAPVASLFAEHPDRLVWKSLQIWQCLNTRRGRFLRARLRSCKFQCGEREHQAPLQRPGADKGLEAMTGRP